MQKPSLLDAAPQQGEPLVPRLMGSSVAFTGKLCRYCSCGRALVVVVVLVLVMVVLVVAAAAAAVAAVGALSICGACALGGGRGQGQEYSFPRKSVPKTPKFQALHRPGLDNISPTWNRAQTPSDPLLM
ncbi:hypothetical protein E2C01_004058 [Portunus trituberculatus]|uniref:Uncharacterized protein n=1 Tax=Portunus trituberculatus TaxID=210409 RepID=A0A5B7CQC4_PORTR|nr:hypothetical protein [Portunus trituberculatus]